MGFSVYFFPILIKVKEISCLSQFGPCNLNLQNSLDKFEGINIRDAKRAVKSVLGADLMTKNYSIHYIIPDKLRVNVIERKAKYALGNLSQANLAVVDENGFIISIEESSNLPTVIKNGDLNSIGEKVSEKELFALIIINNLFNSYQIKEGTIENDSLKVEYNQKTSVIFPLSGDPDFLVSSFSLILKKFESGKIQPKVIDLRFKNPVISE